MKLNFAKSGGLLPVIIQDFSTREVLMLGFMNVEAWERTQREGKVWFWSRTRGKLWKKGESSGTTLVVRRVVTDCDSDTLLILAQPTGIAVCHTGKKSCFYQVLTEEI